MKEQEYINATNKAKIDAARDILMGVSHEELGHKERGELASARISLTCVSLLIGVDIKLEESE